MPSTSLLLVLCGLGGLLVGVAVNIVILRSPTDRSLVGSPNRCGQCDAPMAPVGFLPVGGCAAVGGTCGGCGSSLGAWQPIVEITNAALWMALAAHFGWSLLLPPFLLLASAALALSVVDLFTYRLPDRITFPVLYVSIPVMVVVSLVRGEPRQLLWAAVGSLGYWGLLALLWLISPRSMGYGDVKFARILGLYLGWIHPVLPVYALLVSGVSASVIGIGVALAARDRKKAFPFGPWMAVGAVVAILWSSTFTRGL